MKIASQIKALKTKLLIFEKNIILQKNTRTKLNKDLQEWKNALCSLKSKITQAKQKLIAGERELYLNDQGIISLTKVKLTEILGAEKDVSKLSSQVNKKIQNENEIAINLECLQNKQNMLESILKSHELQLQFEEQTVSEASDYTAGTEGDLYERNNPCFLYEYDDEAKHHARHDERLSFDFNLEDVSTTVKINANLQNYNIKIKSAMEMDNYVVKNTENKIRDDLINKGIQVESLCFFAENE